MSHRSQRMSGMVMTLAPSRIRVGLAALVRFAVITTAVSAAAGKAWSRGATPRVIWM